MIFWILLLEIKIEAKITFFFRSKIDCKTVGFFLKISKEIGKACPKSLTREAREPYTPVGRVRREKKNSPGLALCFQPRSRPLV